jgi:hypothetical protein
MLTFRLTLFKQGASLLTSNFAAMQFRDTFMTIQDNSLARHRTREHLKPLEWGTECWCIRSYRREIDRFDMKRAESTKRLRILS